MKTFAKHIIILILFFYSEVSLSQYVNYRIHPSGNVQIEPSIVKHPLNSSIFFTSAYTLSGALRSEGTYTSTDGGTTWFGTDTCQGAPITSGHGGDPGPIIDKNGVFILTHQGGIIAGMYGNYSINLGINWSSNSIIATNDQDKGNPGTDDVPNSPFYGRTYLAWTKFTSPLPVVISYTTNSGMSWVPYIQVNNTPAGHQSLAPYVVSGPGGILYTTWAAVITNSPFNEDFIGFGKSTNGGNNWNVNESAYDCNGIKTSTLAPWDIRVNGYPIMDVDKTGGNRNGWIYIVTAERNSPPAGADPDIIFHRSSDGGNTWSPGIRVNQDPLNNGRSQFFPFITVDENGGLNVVYYDNRNSPDSVEVFISHSNNGGDTWTDTKISDHKFKPKAVGGTGAGNQGDNIGMIYSNGFLFPVWMDNSTGIYQVWTAKVDLTTIDVKTISDNIHDKFSLYQNYPNPFNPSTIIRFDLTKNSFVKLEVFDITGKRITELVNGDLQADSYEKEFDASMLGSGIYFYKIKVENFVETKRMVLIK
ncbi:MAG TPA: T9SS type A sorting domain-containing protein [Ignavibacteria bacterium]|nr:T9SS type A sorting domain-containing protein [Ignavibacteria bacterium]